MAKDLSIGDKKLISAHPSCDSAAFCCWYETTRELSHVCVNRNNLVCKLRREEVFGDESPDGDEARSFVLAHQTR